MSIPIAKICDSCEGTIYITVENFWMRHGQHLTAQDKQKRFIICDGCANQIITIKRKSRRSKQNERIKKALENT